jgi:hypothetical protein
MRTDTVLRGQVENQISDTVRTLAESVVAAVHQEPVSQHVEQTRTEAVQEGVCDLRRVQLLMVAAEHAPELRTVPQSGSRLQGEVCRYAEVEVIDPGQHVVTHPCND